MFWLIGNRVIIPLEIYMKVTCSIATWRARELASHSSAARPAARPASFWTRENQNMYLSLSPFAALSELFYTPPPNVTFYLCQEKGCDKLRTQCSFGRANFSYQSWGGNETIFQQNEQHHFWTDLLRERGLQNFISSHDPEKSNTSFFFFLSGIWFPPATLVGGNEKSPIMPSDRDAHCMFPSLCCPQVIKRPE